MTRRQLAVALVAVLLPCLLLPLAAAAAVAAPPALPCGTALSPADPAFPNATYIDNGAAGRARQPSLVVLAECAEDVPVAMQYARDHGLPFAVKGGGHSAAGYSLARGGVVLDMSLLNASRVEYHGDDNRSNSSSSSSQGSATLWVQAGATFGQLYARLNATGLILGGGGCSTVGVSGFTLGGGLSFLSRAFGLGSDNLVGVRMAVANGTLLDVSGADPAQADLWWALRGGGGGNFGVVVELRLRLHPGEAVTEVAEVCWRGSEAAAQALPRYSRWLEPADSDDDVDAAVHADPRVGAPALLIRNMTSALPVPPVDLCVTLFAVQGVNVTRELESLVAFANASAAPPDVVTDGCAGPGATFYEWESRCGALKTGVDGDDGYMTSGVLAPGTLDDGVVARRLVTALAASPGDRTIINFHDGGGALRSPAAGGSFAHRGFNLVYQVKGIWVPGGVAKSAANMAWGTELQRALEPRLSGAYLNYIDPLQPDWPRAYYGANYPRLREVKRAVDPEGFFVFNQSIVPAPPATSRAPASGAPVECDPATLVERMYAFQAGQNAQDAGALALMYTEDGANHIPAPAVATVGREAIRASFAAYFATLASIRETVDGPMIVNGNMGAFAKTIETVPKTNATVPAGTTAATRRGRSEAVADVVVTHVVNWFEFDCASSPPLISTFRAMFNASAAAPAA